jgi:CubicO group peptidase (beta-lactamase class C family)
MKINLLLILLLILTFSGSKAQSLYFPPTTGTVWDTLNPASLGWCPDRIDTLLNYLEGRNSKAFILLKDGKIVIEKYFGTFTTDSAWYWASAGKTITSFMVGIAQQENYISIDDTTSDYLGKGWTNCTPEQEEKITLRHQLTMTSGLDDGVPDHHCTLDTCLNYKADAGTRWAYHNGPYTLLDKVIENATGQTLNSYINQKLKIPTGMTGAFFPSGYDNVFYSKARSMARFGLLILNNGNWNGNQIMTGPSYFNQMVNPSQTINKSYGYLWWLNGKESYMMPSVQFVFPGSLVPSAPTDMIAALGKNGQLINIVPSLNLVFIRMGEASGAGEVPTTFPDTIWQKLNDVMTMCSPTGISTGNSKVLSPSIYPNPAQHQFSIFLPGNKFDIACFDINGRLAYEEREIVDSGKIDCKKFARGIYFIRLMTPSQKIYYQKLIITD